MKSLMKLYSMYTNKQKNMLNQKVSNFKVIVCQQLLHSLFTSSDFPFVEWCVRFTTIHFNPWE